MNVRRQLAAFLLLAGALLFSQPASAQLKVVGDGGPGPVKAQHLTAELVSLAPAIAPGGTLQVGLVLTLEEHWHVYWLNAGDSGEPPKITWTLPDGITAAPMQFPIPSRLPLGPLMDFGYQDSVAFPVKLTAAKSLKPTSADKPIHLDAQVRWLVCREVCIPGKAHLGLNLAVTPGATGPASPRGALAEALQLIPAPPPPSIQFSAQGGKSTYALTLITGQPQDDAEFYPFDQDQIANASEQTIQKLPNGVRLLIQRAEDPNQLPNHVIGPLPKQIAGVFKLSDTVAYAVTAPVVPADLPPLPASAAHPAGQAADQTSSQPATQTAPSGVTALSAIGLAFLGGIILNLMPCVFPVLFLKGLALVQSSGEERARLRSHGLVYTLGILVSFWVIVAVLLGLRAGGSQAGWGFQLQSPTFIAVLAAGLFFFALSLAGQFDIGLSLTSVGGELAQKQGYTGSFFTGVLATIVATPCTAPLMGAAIGFALAQPAGITFAVFTALGLGLATPYLALSFQPAWTRLLPRPGAWMETLKQFTAVPLFGTAIWLAWVYGRLYSGSDPGQGVDHLVLLLWAFLIIAIAGWTLGRWPAKWASGIVAVLLVIGALAIPLSQPRETPAPATSTAQSANIPGAPLKWQPYSQQTLDAARAAGHPVFIDFTAAWCLSCQVNERLVLKSDDVQQQFAKKNFTLLRADWTQYDPEITKQLASINRSGVPTYVVYPAAPTAAADVLPELLTKDIVLTALTKDTR
jgi:thiol:disulfide interchange protein DsbD